MLPVEPELYLGIPTRGCVPGARQPHLNVVVHLEIQGREILDLAFRPRPAPGEQADVSQIQRTVRQPHDQIQEMYAQIHQGTATRQPRVRGPAGAGPVGVVETPLHPERPPDNRTPERVAHRYRALQMAITEVCLHRKVSCRGDLEHPGDLIRTHTHGLLDEHGESSVEQGRRLRAMERTRRGDHHAVQILPLRIARPFGGTGLRGPLPHGRDGRGVGVGDYADVGQAVREDLAQAVARYPPAAEQPDSRQPRHAHVSVPGMTTAALTKPGGRRDA